jgi:dolichyl-phosphate beta-glucosyltransferase
MWLEQSKIILSKFILAPNPIDGSADGSLAGPTTGSGSGSGAQQATPAAKVPFTIVIPAYNEERRLPTSIRDIRAFFANIQDPFEVLVMVEKSKDRTVELSRIAAEGDPRIQVIDNQVQRGKGYAVKSGMLRAKGEIVFFTDADLSTPLAEIIAFLQHFRENPATDVAIGSRRHNESQILKRQNLFRQSLGRGFNKLVQMISVRGIKDTQCGFKAFRATACREIFSRQTIDGFAFDVEILMLAQKLGYKIDVLPVRWVNSSDSKVRIFIDPLKMFIDLLRIRWIVQKTVRAKPLSPITSPSHQSLS